MMEGVCEHCGGVFGGDNTPQRVWVLVTHDNCFVGVYATRGAAKRACVSPHIRYHLSEEEVLD